MNTTMAPPPPPVSRFVSTARPHSPAELVSLVSNYLFDLFDANSMDEYRALLALEDACAAHVDPDADEFTFEQQELHATFVKTLEGFVEAYIRSLGRTETALFDASDCLDTLCEMEDIRCWMNGVKQRVRYKRLRDKGNS